MKDISDKITEWVLSHPNATESQITRAIEKIITADL